MTSAELAVPVRLELVASLEAALTEKASPALGARIEDELAALLAELGLPGTPAVEITTGPSTRPLRVVVHGTTVRYPMRMLLSAQPHFAVGPEPWSRSRDLMRSPAAWTSLIERRLKGAEPAEWAAGFVRWLAVTVIRLAPSCLVSDAQAAAYAGAGQPDPDRIDRAFARQVLAGLLDLGVGLRCRDAVLGVMTAGAAAAASPAQVVEQAFRRLRSYEASLVAHPEYLGQLLGSPVERAITSDELHDDVLRQQFGYVGEAVREDLGLPPPRFRLIPDPSVTPGWLSVQVHDQRSWPVLGLRPDALLVLAPARRASQLGLETRAMRNPYTGEQGAEVPAASGPDLDAAGLPYWTASTFTAILTHLGLRRRVEALIGPAEVEFLLAQLEPDHPDLVVLVTRQCTITELTGVLRMLVREGIPIRDLRTILEQLVRQEVGTVLDADVWPGHQGLTGVQQLTSRVRRGLHSAISRQFAGRHRRLLALCPDVEFQRRAVALLRSPEPSEQVRERLLDELWAAVQQASRAGADPVLVTRDDTRWAIRCLVDSELPEVPVLAESEIRSDIDVVSLPWTEARIMVDFLVVCDRVAQFLADLAGPSLQRHGPGTFSFSRGSAAVTVEVVVIRDLYAVVAVSARPPVEMADTPATFEWAATTDLGRGVQTLLERNEQALRPVCSMTLLGDFLDPEEFAFALAMATAAADDVKAEAERAASQVYPDGDAGSSPLSLGQDADERDRAVGG